jgi:hypothetical protein
MVLHKTHLLLVVGGDGVVCLAECHGNEVDHLSEERPLYVHLTQLSFHHTVTLKGRDRIRYKTG